MQVRIPGNWLSNCFKKITVSWGFLYFFLRLCVELGTKIWNGTSMTLWDGITEWLSGTAWTCPGQWWRNVQIATPDKRLIPVLFTQKSCAVFPFCKLFFLRVIYANFSSQCTCLAENAETIDFLLQFWGAMKCWILPNFVQVLSVKLQSSSCPAAAGEHFLFAYDGLYFSF